MNLQLDVLWPHVCEVLTNVVVWGDRDMPDDVVVIEFRDKDSVFSVHINPEDDTVAVRTGPLAEPSNLIVIATDVFRRLYSWTLTNAWLMTNVRGYQDCLQLEFRQQPANEDGITIQLEAIASRIRGRFVEFGQDVL